MGVSTIELASVYKVAKAATSVLIYLGHLREIDRLEIEIIKTGLLLTIKLQIMETIISNFMEIILGKYAQFTGRAGRGEFWKYYLVYFIIGSVFTVLMQLVGNIKFLYYILGGLYLLIVLGLLVPTLALCVRRLHDIGKGGGWIFINLVPVIGSLWFLILMIKEGENVANRFGAPS